MAKYDKMIEATRAKSKRKVELLKKTVDDMIKNNIPVTPYSVGKLTGLSKTFIYKNKEAISYIEKHRSNERFNSRKCITKDCDTNSPYKRSNKELEEENARLRKIIKKYEVLVDMGLLKIPDDMKLDKID